MGEIRQFLIEGDNQPALADNIPLWRYVPLKTLLVYLSGKAFIPSIETLRKQDPFEGEFFYDQHPTFFNNACESWHGQKDDTDVRNWIFENRFDPWLQQVVRPVADDQASPNLNNSAYREEYLNILRTTRCAWCWFEQTEHVESAAMLNLYGKGGVMVGTTIGLLKGALRSLDRDFEIARMTYVPVGPFGDVHNGYSIHPELMLRPHFLKRAEYRSEQEVRVITSTAKPSTGVTLDLQPKEWIREIRLHPAFESAEVAAIQTAIQSTLPEVARSQSGLLGRTQPDPDAAFQAHFASEIPEALKRLWPHK